MAASNALTGANMALAGYDAVIPLDEVVDAMDRIGKSLPSSYVVRHSADGLLRAPQKIEKKLKKPNIS
jgi:L-serine dehydratase